MRKIGIIFVVLILLINFSFMQAKGKKIGKLKFPELAKIEKPVISKSVLKNGMVLRIIEDNKFPIIDLKIMIKGGDVFDPSSKVGLASITSQLLRIGGTHNMKGEEIDRQLDSKGISISISSRFDYFTIDLSSLKDNFDEAVGILADILMSPEFDKEKFNEIKVQMSSSVARKNDDSSIVKDREFDKLIYGEGSPFGASLEYDDIDNIKLSDVKSFYKKFFAPSNMLIGMTGPVNLEKAQNIIEKYFGGWKKDINLPVYPEVNEKKHDFKVAFAEKSGLSQSQISIGHLGVKENIDEKAKILIFNSIFSQGFNSRLMQRLRVKMGLTYGIGGGILSRYLYPGKVYFSTFTKSESTIDAVNAIFDEIRKIREEKVTPQELKDAKDYFINSYVFKFSSPEKVLFNYLVKEFYGLDINRYENLLDDIRTVTVDDVYDVANKYLDPEKMVTLIVGTRKNIKGKLSDIGKVKEIDISIKPPKLKEVIPEATPESLAKGKKLVQNSIFKNYSGYKQVRSIKQTSEMNLKIQGRELGMTSITTTLYPDKVFNEISVMGMKIIKIVNGDRGVIKQMGQKKELGREDIEKSRFGEIYDIIRSGNKYNFQYLKEKKINNKIYDIVYVSDKKDNWIKFFIDRKTGLIEIEEKIENIAGREGLARIVNSNFKRYNKIMIPSTVRIFMKGEKLIEAKLTDFKVDISVDKSIFKID